jgi:hypothetical protein
MISAGRWIADFAAVIDPQGLVECGADGLDHTALDLPAALHGVDNRTCVRSTDASQNAHLAVASVDVAPSCAA